jgi:hypothetical protein
MMKPMILMQASPSVAPSPPPIAEWGVVGAVLFLVVKSAIDAFNKNDDQQAKMLERLLNQQQDREHRMIAKYEQVLDAILELQKKTHDCMVRMEASVNELTRLRYSDSRSIVESLVALRSEVSTQRSVLNELLRRSDKELGISRELPKVRKLPQVSE